MTRYLRVDFSDGSTITHPLDELEDLNRVWSWLDSAVGDDRRDQWQRAWVSITEDAK